MDTAGFIGFVATVGGLIIGLVTITMGIVVGTRAQLRRTELLIAFKRELLERGMTPHEIRTVLDAGFDHPQPVDKDLALAELEHSAQPHPI